MQSDAFLPLNRAICIVTNRVLVTGADGFIGSHLVELLAYKGHEVRAFCMYNSNGSFGWLDERARQASNDVDFFLGDIRDQACVAEACKDVDIVFHLAALVSVPYSYEAPMSFIKTNIEGTHNVLQASQAAGIGRVVHVSTSEVYGTPLSVPISETHPLQAQSPYSASKIAADKLCEAWASSFDLPVVVVRPFNTYGPRQSARAVIPTIIAQLLSSQRSVHVGSLLPQRDFTFVSDTAEGIRLAGIADLQPGSVVQLGTGCVYSVEEIIQAVGAALNVEPTVVEDPQRVRPPRSEVAVLQSDPSRARSLLGWGPSTTFTQGLIETINWWRLQVANHDASRYYR
jgi:NAD dependent epimerase/dehydratase